MADKQVTQWAEDAQFILTGKEFELFINVVRAILLKPESQEILALARLSEIMDNKLKEGVDKGIVTLAEQKETPA